MQRNRSAHRSYAGNLQHWEEKGLASVKLCETVLSCPKSKGRLFSVRLLVNMRNSLSQFKRAESLQDIEVNEGYLSHCFATTKQQLKAKFRALLRHLEDCKKFSADTRIADENEEDIKKFSSEVRLSNVVFKLHDIDENWQIKYCQTCVVHITLKKKRA